jgi:hypothetical protein
LGHRDLGAADALNRQVAVREVAEGLELDAPLAG